MSLEQFEEWCHEYAPAYCWLGDPNFYYAKIGGCIMTFDSDTKEAVITNEALTIDGLDIVTAFKILGLIWTEENG